MHAKECVCVCVQALALTCVCGRGIKKGLLSVCILLVHVCVYACVLCSRSSCLGELSAVWGNGASHCGGDGMR